MKKWILFIVTILLLCSSVARADDFDDAIDAYQKGNYVQAIELFRPLATHGDASAQFNLGVMHDIGEGVIQDYKEAVKWYLLAAKQGYADAQYNLGVMYAEGKGVKQDHREAEKWYLLAAEQGNASAEYNLGLKYDYGKGVTQDYKEAAMWPLQLGRGKIKLNFTK